MGWSKLGGSGDTMWFGNQGIVPPTATATDTPYDPEESGDGDETSERRQIEDDNRHIFHYPWPWFAQTERVDT
eukprot:scaffold257202_cov55-Attheya_sp.AAC.1